MSLPRVFISTDLRLESAEKDDAQSLIHALLYQDKIDIVGISATASKWGIQDGLVGDVRKIIDAYEMDQSKLQGRSDDFKDADALRDVSWQGATEVAPQAGFSTPTDGSQAIIVEARKAAAAGENLNVLTWGGETDIAQALHDAPDIAQNVRLFTINRQDNFAFDYIASNFKGKLDMWVDNRDSYGGMWRSEGTPDLITGWHGVHADGHGALGDMFADMSINLHGKDGVKMGDSPTILRFISGDQDDPRKESWGGEFRLVSDGYYTDLEANGRQTIAEDRQAWLASFEERLDWIKESGPAPAPAPVPPTDGNLLVNGSFESTTLAAGSYADFGSVAGWSAVSGGRIEIWNALKGVNATDGKKFVELDFLSARDGFYQDVRTLDDQSYTLSFDLRGRPGVSRDTQQVEVLWNGKVVDTATPGSGWGSFTADVTGTGGNDRLTIREVSAQSADGLGALLDNFVLEASRSAAPTPAPAPEEAEASVHAEFSILNSWTTSYQGQFTITNQSAEPIQSWSIFATGSPLKIRDVWGSQSIEVTKIEEGLYLVEGSGKTLEPGKSASITYTGNGPAPSDVQILPQSPAIAEPAPEPVPAPAPTPAPVPPTDGNLLVNGSFESTTLAAGSYADFGSVAGWSAVSGGRIEIWNALKGVNATDGKKFVELDFLSARDGFYQDVRTLDDQSYTLSFDLRGRPGVSRDTQQVEVLWNGKVVDTATPGSGWGSFTADVTGTGGNDRLTIREVSAQSADGLGALLDNFVLEASRSAAPTPAPAPEEAEASVHAEFSILNSWTTSYQGQFTITNQSAEPIQSWSIFATGSPLKIRDVWGSQSIEVTKIEEGLYLVEGSGKTLEPGKSASITYTGNGPAPSDVQILPQSPAIAEPAPEPVPAPAPTPAPVPPTGEVIKIMPLGDSNTFGMWENDSSPGGYRGPLQDMLSSHSDTFDFVGLDRDGKIADPDHNGYSGMPIDWFTSRADQRMLDRDGSYSNTIDTGNKTVVQHFIDEADMTSSDVILLMAGGNDVRLGDSAEKMLAEMRVLLDQIVDHPQSPLVHLMTLPFIARDRWDDGSPRTNNDTIRIFNDGLEKMVDTTYGELGVTLVKNGVTSSGLSSDGVHPNQAGYDAMAEAWADLWL